MSIPISSNFNLSTQLPLDARTVVADITARDLIPSIQRYEGLIVYVTDTNTNYQLQGGIDNTDWVEFGTGTPMLFGIGDNLGLQDRSMDMQQKSFGISNAIDYYIEAANSDYSIFSGIASDQTGTTINAVNLNNSAQSIIYIQDTSLSFKVQRGAGISTNISIPNKTGNHYFPLSVQVNGTETFADTAGKIDLGTIGGGVTNLQEAFNESVSDGSFPTVNIGFNDFILRGEASSYIGYNNSDFSITNSIITSNNNNTISSAKTATSANITTTSSNVDDISQVELYATSITDSKTQKITVTTETITISGESALGLFPIIKIENLPSFSDDTAAAIGGIPVNGLYRNGSVLMIRVS